MRDYQTVLNEVFDEFGIVGTLDETLDILKNSNLTYDLESSLKPQQIQNMLKSGDDLMIMTPKGHETVAFTAIYKEYHGIFPNAHYYISFDYDTDAASGTLEEMGETTRLPPSFFDAKFTLLPKMNLSDTFDTYQVSPYDNELTKFLSSLGGKTRNILEGGERKQLIEFTQRNIHDDYNNKIRVYHSTIFKMLSMFQPINMAFPQSLKNSLLEAFEARKV